MMILRKFLFVRSLHTSPAPGRREGRLRRSLEGGAALIRLAQCIEQSGQMARVIVPPPDGAVIKRLSHLPTAGRCDRPLCPVKIEAGRLPIEAEERNEPAALALEIVDQRLVLNIEHAQRQDPVPVSAEALGFQIPFGAIGEVVREHELARAELLEITGKTNVARIAPAEDDAGAREQCRDDAERKDIVRQFVEHPFGATA